MKIYISFSSSANRIRLSNYNIIKMIILRKIKVDNKLFYKNKRLIDRKTSQYLFFLHFFSTLQFELSSDVISFLFVLDKKKKSKHARQEKTKEFESCSKCLQPLKCGQRPRCCYWVHFTLKGENPLVEKIVSHKCSRYVTESYSKTFHYQEKITIT